MSPRKISFGKTQMSEDFFKVLEGAAAGTACDFSEALSALRFNEAGLIPTVAQCADSGRVLMLAWMSRESLLATLRGGRMVYFSRRRNCLWRKGDTSGHIQELVGLSADCDGDALLAKVRQTGPACHTGRPACFYLRLTLDSLTVQEEED